MEAWSTVKEFWDYLEFYAYEGEEGFDGIHDGGIKGIRVDAPESAKKAYAKWAEEEERNKKLGIKV